MNEEYITYNFERVIGCAVAPCLACWSANREVWGFKYRPGQKCSSRFLLHLRP